MTSETTSVTEDASLKNAYAKCHQKGLWLYDIKSNLGRYTVKETGQPVKLLLLARQDRYLGGPQHQY